MSSASPAESGMAWRRQRRFAAGRYVEGAWQEHLFDGCSHKTIRIRHGESALAGQDEAVTRSLDPREVVLA